MTFAEEREARTAARSACPPKNWRRNWETINKSERRNTASRITTSGYNLPRGACGVARQKDVAQDHEKPS